MAHGLSLVLREIKPNPTVVPGTECYQKPNGGWSRCMPFVGASRDRSLPGKKRIRARKAAQRGA